MNTDIRISVSFKGHRKRKKLRRILGDRSDSYLIDLWITVSTDCPKGVLTGWNKEDIADACGWDGDPSEITEAFINSGWIDVDENGVYTVHDWEKHQAWACNADKRSEAARVAANKRWNKPADSEQNVQESDKDSMRGACEPHKDGNAPFLSFPNLPSHKQTLEDEFELFWDSYNKKKDRDKCFKKWKKLTKSEKESIFKSVYKYVESTKDKQYRKNPLTWLNGKCWEDEINPSEKSVDDWRTAL